MAVATLALSARRAAILLRCQTVRERRRGLDAARLDRDRFAAESAERQARDAEREGRHDAETRLSRAYDAFAGGVVGPGDLGTLPVLRRQLAAEAARLHDASARAERTAVAARAAADAARAAHDAERRRTESRAKLAERARKALLRGLEAAEETELDDENAGRWPA